MHEERVSILGTGKGRAGAAILCCALILSLSTGMAFAANAYGTPKSDQSAQSTSTTPISTEQQEKLDRQRNDEKAREYSEYAAFGMTYDTEKDLFLFEGKVVRRFYDEAVGRGFTSNNYDALDFADYDKSVDLTAVRNANGKLTGFSSASKEDFDQRTARIEQSWKRSNNQYTASGSVSVGESTTDNSPNEAAFAANAYGTPKSDQSAQSTSTAPISPDEQAKLDQQRKDEKAREWVAFKVDTQ